MVDVCRLTVIPALALWVTLWVCSFSPLRPAPQQNIEAWMLDEAVVCEAFHFNHQQYLKWLRKKR